MLTGAKYVSATVAQTLASHLGPGQSQPPHELLSSREFEILRMIDSGQSIKEIAAALCVSLQTVSTHRARMLKKMGLFTTSSLNCDVYQVSITSQEVDTLPMKTLTAISTLEAQPGSLDVTFDHNRASRILVVEDDESMAANLAVRLKAAGYEYDLASQSHTTPRYCWLPSRRHWSKPLRPGGPELAAVPSKRAQLQRLRSALPFSFLCL